VEPEDDRSAMAKAMSLVSQITAIALMMVLPALVGYFVDRGISTLPLFTVIGMLLGLAAAIYQLVKLVAALEMRGPKRENGAGKN
jgi:F0F1-type ATP synthase assembly protein I